MQDKHILLIGFKSVGKTTLGQLLAQKTNMSFLDLDAEITQHHFDNTNENLNTCDIYRRYGAHYFRNFETEVLLETLKKPTMVLALGGGAPLNEALHDHLQQHCLIYITAEKEIIYKRIMQQGIPAFFESHQDTWQEFNRLYEEREPIYRKLATLTIDHSNTTSQALETLMQALR